MNTFNALVISPDDSVAVVTENIQEKGTVCYQINGQTVRLTSVTSVPVYHKVAIKNIHKGDNIYKYGQPIGRASQDIPAGTHVHTHNLVSVRETV
ncbi:UxaA family hydrolase [Salmonella enterica]|uniref:Hydrolase n=1 Tax=Salmonella enterica subsp. salamae serovar 48:d:z6 TaxID=1151170 RepID=A0A701V026_SALER|nr:hydrolase [Salmonella enterica]EBU9317683.1 hydrolase [Salmonella enterica subsp. enterica serovar Amager]EBW4031952.1 hydrolase [Salmonella enterica subsp. enterica serovar Newport]ECD6162257.1 hydrolase [Salmonella enterica subsp. enterica]ECU7995305.1 hydrolase [Salmonella enterica subsp. enterica serovar Toucra]EHQ1784596.1 UxaA family hydrolase [Salmonella enterica subsp. enterica serovar Oranienburg]HAC6544525.1 hydrolase [Salmonella enterica subsp. salamae serovar 48:d:z6]